MRSAQHRLAAEYGAEFTQAAWSLTPGTWSAPVASRYGWHLVKVLSRTEVRPATFEDVSRELVLDFVIPVAPPAPTGRLGIRTEASGED